MWHEYKEIILSQYFFLLLTLFTNYLCQKFLNLNYTWVNYVNPSLQFAYDILWSKLAQSLRHDQKKIFLLSLDLVLDVYLN
jgi:hypothetical protein